MATVTMATRSILRWLGASAAFILLVVSFLVISGTLRTGLPDQAAMERYLSNTPIDDLAGVSGGTEVIQRLGENPRLCFLCSEYGVMKSFDILIPSDSESRQEFCELVYSSVVEWQKGSEVGRSSPIVGGWCKVEVSEVVGHRGWAMSVFVSFASPRPADNPSVSIHLEQR